MGNASPPTEEGLPVSLSSNTDVKTWLRPILRAGPSLLYLNSLWHGTSLLSFPDVRFISARDEASPFLVIPRFVAWRGTLQSFWHEATHWDVVNVHQQVHKSHFIVSLQRNTG